MFPGIKEVAAINSRPSAEEAMELQPANGAPVCTQVIPEFVETKMWLKSTAASFVPSAEDATACQP